PATRIVTFGSYVSTSAYWARTSALNSHPGKYLHMARKAMREAISQILRPAGFDLIRVYRLPRTTFLGLTQFPINTIVDGGPNRGQFAPQALAFFPPANIISFEPQPIAFQALQRLAAKRRGTITPVNLALGDTEGVARMQVHVDWDFSSSLLLT